MTHDNHSEQTALLKSLLHPAHLQQILQAVPYVAPPPHDEGLSLNHYLKLIKKHASLIITTGCLSAAIASLYCLLTPALYTADTTIEIKGYAPILATSQTETLFGNDTRKIEYQKTTIAKLKLEGLADRVLSKNNLAEDLEDYWDSRRSLLRQWMGHLFSPFRGTAKAESLRSNDPLFLIKPSVLTKYLNLIDIAPIHETNLVSIQATTALPELSQRLANTHAVGFTELLQRERQEVITTNLQLLQRQAQELKARVTAAEQQLSTYAANNKIFAVGDGAAGITNGRQIESLSGLLAEATGRRIKTESLLAEVQNKKVEDLAVTDDEGTRQLRTMLQQVQSEYATLGSKVTPAHPSMLELRAKIESLKQSISEDRKRAVRIIQTQFANEKSAETRLRAQIDGEKGLAQDMSKQLIQYNVLAKEASSLRDLYQAVLKQVKEIEISASSAASNVFITDYAALPTSPSAPKTNLIITLFAIVGIAVGLIIALVMEAFDNTLKTTDDVQGALDLPLLGAVPEFGETYNLLSPPSPGAPPALPSIGEITPNGKSVSFQEQSPDKHLTQSPHIMSINAPNNIVSEALRTIRAGILLSSADHPPRIIMITSAMKGEGKTTVLYNLAATLAQASHRTVMIDGDLRERGLTKLFCRDQTPGGVGLSDYLTGQAELSQVIRPTPVHGLDILPAGNRAPNPAELLSSAMMRQLISDLSNSYDFVLVDSPPILPVADGLTLSRIVDSVVLVVRSRTTERELAQESRRRLLRVNARILGVVLNDLDITTDERDQAMYGGYASGMDEGVIT
jgi:capsular exopolysaccharide synthesis family protein